MDRKSIILIIVAAAVLILVSPVVDRFFPPQPVPVTAIVGETNQIEAGTNLPAPPLAPAAAATVSAPGIGAETAPASNAPEKMVSVSNDYLIVQFTSKGGGVKAVELKKYPAVTVRQGEQAADKQGHNFATLNAEAPFAVMAVIGSGFQGDSDFQLSQSGRSVVATRSLGNGLRLVKEFAVGSNCLFTAKVRIENTTAKPAAVPARELIVGTSSPVGPLEDPTTLGVMWYNGLKSTDIKDTWFANRTLGCLPGAPRYEYEDGAGNVAWVASHSQFFALAAIPSNPAPAVIARKIELPAPETYGLATSKGAVLTNGYQASCSYPGSVLEGGKSLEEDFTFYAGPKEYKSLAQMGRKMRSNQDLNLDLIMNFTGPFGFFSKLLLLIMNGLHAMGLAYGLTIIVLTVIIKLVFWPLTTSATKSQKRLQELQPQLKAIADKYKDDPVKKNQKTMEFMKTHKVSPLGSCLPMLLQIPVFFGFYWMLRSAIELRGVRFLWAFDLSQPDTIAHLGGVPINPLPLIMGATQLWQAHLTPPSPGMDPAQQKLMRYMPLIFIGVFYGMPSGLTLYWTVQNLLTILQTKLTKTSPAEEPKARPGVPVPAPGKKKK